MTRPLRTVPSGNPLEVMARLREALTAGGEALLPLPGPVPGGPAALGAVPRPVAVVIETSGSSDAPKRVMLTADALLASAAASSVALGGPGQWLLALPAHYIAGVQVLVRSIAAETIPVILPAGHVEPASWAARAEELTEPLRFTSLVPVQLARLLAAADRDPRVLAVLRRFNAILVGGQAVRPALAARAAELDVRIVRTYGSSETAGGCVYDGLPIGNTALRAVDGQLEISGAVLAAGYLGDDNLTRERFIDVHGVRWYRTGDLGEIDPAGRVRVLGRADNVIISGGEKVSLDAVERVVRSLPGLEEAVVVAADSAEWGQVPVVVSEAPASGVRGADLARVTAAVASALGRAARPARLVVVAAIPLLASGKPDRRAVRELAGAADK